MTPAAAAAPARLQPVGRVAGNIGKLDRSGGKSIGLTLNSAPSPTAGVPIKGVIPGGQGEKVGFKVGQNILTMNGKDVRGFTLQQAGGEITTSQSLEIQVDGPVTPAAAAAPARLQPVGRVAGNIGKLDRSGGKSIGLTLNGAPSPTAGVPIVAVIPGGQGEKVGFQQGQSILTMNGKDVRGFTLQQAGGEITKNQSLEVQVDGPVTPATAADSAADNKAKKAKEDAEMKAKDEKEAAEKKVREEATAKGLAEQLARQQQAAQIEEATKARVAAAAQAQNEKDAQEKAEKKKKKAEKKAEQAKIAAALPGLDFDDVAAYKEPANTRTLSRANGQSIGLTLNSANSGQAVPITAVIPGGQGEKAGFTAGQNILSINGEDVRGFTLQQVGGIIGKSEQLIIECDKPFGIGGDDDDELYEAVVNKGHMGTLSRKNNASIGLTLVGAPKKGEPLPISGIIPGSQAEKAGFKKGQKIFTINGKNVRGFSLKEAGQLIVSGETVVFEVDSPLVPPAEDDDLYVNVPSSKGAGVPDIPENSGSLNQDPNDPIGLKIQDAPTPGEGLPIVAVHHGLQADRLGFQVGQKVVKVNSIDVRGFTIKKAGALIAASQQVVVQVDGAVIKMRKKKSKREKKEPPGPAPAPAAVATGASSASSVVGRAKQVRLRTNPRLSTSGSSSAKPAVLHLPAWPRLATPSLWPNPINSKSLHNFAKRGLCTSLASGLARVRNCPCNYSSLGRRVGPRRSIHKTCSAVKKSQ